MVSRLSVSWKQWLIWLALKFPPWSHFCKENVFHLPCPSGGQAEPGSDGTGCFKQWRPWGFFPGVSFDCSSLCHFTFTSSCTLVSGCWAQGAGDPISSLKICWAPGWYPSCVLRVAMTAEWGGQESFSACWNTNHVGFAPSRVFCCSKGSWQYFWPFYFFFLNTNQEDLLACQGLQRRQTSACWLSPTAAELPVILAAAFPLFKGNGMAGVTDPTAKGTALAQGLRARLEPDVCSPFNCLLCWILLLK